jgi:hypothetical protein
MSDSLSGVTRQRVIIQFRNSLSRSIRHADVADALASVALCEPPPVDVLVFATSGRFTGDWSYPVSVDTMALDGDRRL